MKILKQEKGSITLFVLISMLFFVMYLVGMYMLSASLESSQIAETARIKEIYEQGVDNIDDVYNSLIGENQKVNAPVYKGTGLTPVTISEDGTITAASTTTANWYSYDGTVNHWANAKTKDGSMWVWIPRYAYKITYNNESNKSTGGTIDVVFLKGTTNNDFNGNDVTSENYIDANGKTGAYIVHPAFQDGTKNGYANGEWDEEIEGFWMAKFEAGYAGNVGDPSSATDSGVTYKTIKSWTGSNTVDYAYNYYYQNGERAVGSAIKFPTFQANRASVNFIGIADAYDLCMKIKDGTSVYGLNNVDSHLTKNSEWGAVAYLAHSKYGRDGEEVVLNNVTIDNDTESLRAVTGYAAAATESTPATSASPVTTTLEAVQNGTLAGSWTTPQGQTASTTGNVYGIYDLSGGEWEWTAAYIQTNGDYEDYSWTLKGDSSKYKTKYAYSGTGETDTSNYAVTENQNRIGDAIHETSTAGTGTTSWNEDFSIFSYTTFPFFLRGGLWDGWYTTGTFAFYRDHGYGGNLIGFRAVLVAE